MALQSRERGGLRRLREPSAIFVAALLAALASLGGAPRAATAPPSLEAEEDARVKRAIDGDTLELEDGRLVRLVGIVAPKPPLDAEPGRRWPLAERATAALAELALGREVRLGYGGRRSDRYGRLLAQLHRKDGVWLQGELLSRGLARVLSHADNRALVPAMLEREADARDQRRGLWAYRSFAVLEPREAPNHVESFELVEGRVERLIRAGGQSLLAFGSEPRRGLAVVLLPESRRLFAAAGLAPESLEGRRLRVRGFIRWWNGPVIEVSHPEQIELIGP